MKYPNLLWLVASLLLVAACSKKDTQAVKPENPETPTTPVVVSKIKASFGAELMGPGELADMEYLGKAIFLTITDGKAGDSYQYTFTAVDTTISGTGRLDGDGKGNINPQDIGSLHGRKDGELKVSIQFADTTLTTTTKLETHTIRDYKDLLALNWRGPNVAADEVYTQVADVAFPDTTFGACPIQNIVYGTYDGQGHKITNLKIVLKAVDAANENPFIALFKYLYGGTIKNVQLELAGISVKASVAGMVRISGLLANGSAATILNCSVKGDFDAEDGPTVFGGGIACNHYKGKMIGCSYTGKVNNMAFGGLCASMAGQIDMCYAKFDYTGTRAAGVSYFTVNSGNDGTWYISNTYTYINLSEGSSALYAFSTPQNNFSHFNCYSNQATTASGTAQYTSVAAMNAELANLAVVTWPDGVPEAAGKKPFIANGDDLMKLWWQ